MGNFDWEEVLKDFPNVPHGAKFLGDVANLHRQPFCERILGTLMRTDFGTFLFPWGIIGVREMRAQKDLFWGLF